MHGVISPMMMSPGCTDPVGGGMQRLIVAVGDHHAEIILGAEITHAMFDDGGKFVFFQARPRVFVQRGYAGIGDGGGAPQSFQLERSFAARHVFNDVLGVGWSLLERPNDLIVHIDMHRFAADEPDLAGNTRQTRPQFFEWLDVLDEGFLARAGDIPRRRQIKHRLIFERHHEHGFRADADEVGEIGDVIHAQEVMPSGIVNQQGLQSLVAHRLTHLGQPFFEFRSFIHSHLVNLAAILIKSMSLISLKKVAKLFPLHHRSFENLGGVEELLPLDLA